jgi:hypothetical protein
MMNAEETVLLLTWVNQHDPRVQLNAASRDIWAYSLAPFTAAEAKQAILDHYRLNDSIPVSPGAIRKRADDHRAVTEGRQSAIEANPKRSSRNPTSWRSRNPEEWDRLMEEGRLARQSDLRSRGRL